MPGATAQTALITSSGNAVPVGLLGLASNTTSGAVSAIAATASSGSTVKSSRRGKVRQPLWVLRAYSGYIE
jgi:hypothetical protein